MEETAKEMDRTEIVDGANIDQLPLTLQYAILRIIDRYREYGNRNINNRNGNSRKDSQILQEGEQGNSTGVQSNNEGESGNNSEGSIGFSQRKEGLNKSLPLSDLLANSKKQVQENRNTPVEEALKIQAEREGGQFLILSPETGLAAALSTLPSSISYI